MIRVGRVIAPFGVKGACKVESLTDFGERFAEGATLQLDGERTVEWSRAHPPHLLVKLSGVETREDAERLRGRFLEIPDDAEKELPPGEYYHHQLIGLAVESEGGQDLGRLTAVLERPANDVWVASQSGVEQLIPAISTAVLRVDLGAGKVVVADWILDHVEA